MTNLEIHSLVPDGLFQDLEAQLRMGNRDAARAIARNARGHFPLHPAHRKISDALAAHETAPEILAQLGWAKPWHLSHVPKKAHFYWGSENGSVPVVVKR